MPPKDEKMEKLTRLAENGNLTVYAANLTFLTKDEIADFERQKILLFCGYSDAIPCNKCPKQSCTAYPKIVTYPNKQQKGVWLCTHPDQGGMLEFDLEEMKYWDVNLEGLGVNTDNITNASIVEIDLAAFSNGGSKNLLEDLIARPGGVSYNEKHHGKQQPDTLKQALKRGAYANVAKHIHKEKGRIFVTEIQLTKKNNTR